MRHTLFIAVLALCASFPALAQTANTQTDGKTPDEAAIKKLMEDLAAAWNTHDGFSFAMLFAEDADFTNWRATTRLHGREDIKKMNANLAVGMFRRSTLTLTAAHVRFFAPDVAAVHCEWDLVGAIDYNGKGTVPPRKYFPLFIVTKKNGNWSIAVMHNLLFQPLPPGAIIGPPKE